MSTHAGIAQLLEDGSVRSIYVHHDGDAVGKTLVSYYGTRACAASIVALGNLSGLGTTLDPEPKGMDILDPHRRAYTDAYGRDRRENDQNPRVWESLRAWTRDGYSYMYVWMPAGEGGPEGWYIWLGGREYAPLGTVRRMPHE